jgi:hypothetical protein
LNEDKQNYVIEREKEPPDITLKVLSIRAKYPNESWDEKSLRTEGFPKEGPLERAARVTNKEDVPFDEDNPLPTPRPPASTIQARSAAENDEEEREKERYLVESLNISFPSPAKIETIPLIARPRKGLLAAQELMPITRYGGADDIGFYAKSVTIVWDDDQGRPTYYRGNALIRISQRDTRLGPKFPSRRRVKFMRERLSRSKQPGRSEKKEPQDLPNSKVPGDTPAVGHENRKARENNEAGERNIREGASRGLTKEEVAAVVRKLTNAPLDERFDKKTYRVEKNESGEVTATRIPRGEDTEREEIRLADSESAPRSKTNSGLVIRG